MGKLTTHVLDTARGSPAAGMTVELFRRDADDVTLLRRDVTNGDGRLDQPLLDPASIASGRYRLVFAAGAFFRAHGVALPDVPFIDEVIIDFGIADAALDYHVPLLVSPWSYTTYRGS